MSGLTMVAKRGFLHLPLWLTRRDAETGPDLTRRCASRCASLGYSCPDTTSNYGGNRAPDKAARQPRGLVTQRALEIRTRHPECPAPHRAAGTWRRHYPPANRHRARHCTRSGPAALPPSKSAHLAARSGPIAQPYWPAQAGGHAETDRHPVAPKRTPDTRAQPGPDWA